MRRCTLAEVALFSGGRLVKGDPDLPVDRLHTDTRTLLAGDCFVALQGDRFDGHAFVPQAKNHGAVACPTRWRRCNALRPITASCFPCGRSV